MSDATPTRRPIRPAPARLFLALLLVEGALRLSESMTGKLEGTKVSDQDVNKLRQALPNCEDHR